MEIEKVIEIINAIRSEDKGIEEEKKFIDFILNCESNMYSGKDEDGNTIVVAIEKNSGARVSTYQDNGWIRVVDYDVVKDEDDSMYVQCSETYER